MNDEIAATLAAMSSAQVDLSTSAPQKKKYRIGGQCRFCGGKLKNEKATAHRSCRDAAKEKSAKSKKNIKVWKVLPRTSDSTSNRIWCPDVESPSFAVRLNTQLRHKKINSHPQIELVRRDCLKTLRGTLEKLCQGANAVKRDIIGRVKSKSSFQAFEMWHACRLLHDHEVERGDSLVPSGAEDVVAMRRLQRQLRAGGMSFAHSRRVQPELNKASKRVAQVFRRRRDQCKPGSAQHVQIKTVPASATVTLQYKTTRLEMNYEHFKKLEDLYTNGNDSTFSKDVFCLLQRYSSLIGFYTQGAGFQAAMHGDCFDVLRRHLDCRFECFASPLNARYRHYCSAFPDTDVSFGSCGSFFDLSPDKLFKGMDDDDDDGISFEANPPFVPEIITKMALHIEHLLRNLEKKTLSFVVIIPTWEDCRGHQLLAESKFLRARVTLDQKSHGYCEGAQHIRSVSSFRVATQATSIFFVQNEKGAKKWPITDGLLSSNIDLPTMMNSIVSECCWGPPPPAQDIVSSLNLEEKLKLAKEWSSLPNISLQTEKPPESPVGSMTYGEYLEFGICLPKKNRHFFKNNFTESNHAGAKFRENYEELMAIMKAKERPPLPHSTDSPYHFILPSFFNLVTTLHQNGRDFGIVFRTFGIDLEEVCFEFNRFCEGKHPLSKGILLDGSDGGIDRRVSLPYGTGHWSRTKPFDVKGKHDDGISLTLVDEESKFVRNVKGAKQCLQSIEKYVFGNSGARTLALQDDWPYWARNGEADNSGKILLVRNPLTDLHEATDGIHHIFFDDNIERSRSHIVDARDFLSGEALKFENTKGIWLVKAEPLHAIGNESYFVEEVEKCERKLDEYIKKVRE
eukprot:g2922.t1